MPQPAPVNELSKPEQDLPGTLPDDDDLAFAPPAERFTAEDGYVTTEESESEPAAPAAKTPAADDPEEATRARQFGWVDRQEWIDAGKPEKNWRPAADFNAFREQAAPILARENRELRQEIKRIQESIRIKDEAEGEARKHLARESLLLELKQARENNDWDRAFEINEKLVDLKIEEKAAPKPAVPPADAETIKTFTAFIERNPVLKTDTKLQKFLAREVKLILDSGTADNDTEETLDDAWDSVKRRYPERFSKSAPIADTGGTSGANAPGRAWNDLKPKVKAEYEHFMRENPAIKRENLLKRFPADYFRS